MGGFATWGDMAVDALIHGAEFAVALGGVTMFIAYGVGMLASLFRLRG